VTKRRANRAVAPDRPRLDETGGRDRRAAVLDWLDQYWNWRLPPAILEEDFVDLQGTRRGRPFLVLSESESSGSDFQWGVAMSRTCVFIAGPGAQVRPLPAESLPPLLLPVHLAITPAGLFAYWAGHSDYEGGFRGERLEQILDQLLDVADREGLPS
jgi:hypothetical protein